MDPTPLWNLAKHLITEMCSMQLNIWTLISTAAFLVMLFSSLVRFPSYPADLLIIREIWLLAELASSSCTGLTTYTPGTSNAFAFLFGKADLLVRIVTVLCHTSRCVNHFLNVIESMPVGLFCPWRCRWTVVCSLPTLWRLGEVLFCSHIPKLPASIPNSPLLRYKLSLFWMEKRLHHAD